jgi:hypothetical protein
MKTYILLLLPHLISWITGLACLLLVLPVQSRGLNASAAFLAAAAGWGISGFLTFIGILTLGHWHNGYVLGLHGALLLTLTVFGHPKWIKHFLSLRDHFRFRQKSCGLWAILALAMLPLWELAQFFPHGGWDAWQVWNFKAKFLFLAGERWRELFDPQLWRSSPHYPLLLPLINVWGWTFTPQAPPAGPMITGFLMTAAITGLIFAILRETTHHDTAILAPLLLITHPFFGLLAISQYSDLLLGYYLLTALLCLLKALNENSQRHALLAGFFLGCLGFTKPEGVIAAGCVLLTLIAQQGRLYLKQDRPAKHLFAIKAVVSTLTVSSLPLVIFHIFLSPGNQTFVNGWAASPPIPHLERLKFVLVFLLSELEVTGLVKWQILSGKWHGVWLALGIGVILGGKHCFRSNLWIIPLSTGLYVTVVVFYYLTNTYFDLSWWLRVSLHRILFSLLPLFVLWTFLAAHAIIGPKNRGPKTSCPPT